jgi:hypothetical protein
MSKDRRDKKDTLSLSITSWKIDLFEKTIDDLSFDRAKAGDEMFEYYLNKYNPQGVREELIRQREGLDKKINELSTNVKAVEKENRNSADGFINKLFLEKKYVEPEANYVITGKWLSTIFDSVKACGMNDDEAKSVIIKKVNELESEAQRDRFKVAAREFWGFDDGFK